jgi:HD-like signal output (HDOD) protein
MPTLDTLVPHPRVLGTHPDTLRALDDLLDDEHLDADLLLDVLEVDAGITARLLATANSAGYARGRPIHGPEEAVRRLGLIPARDLTIEAICGKLHEDAPSPLLDRARTTAHTARAIAHELGEDGNLVWTAGLFHNLGRVLLLRAPGLDTDGLWVDLLADVRGAEEARLGFSQATLGAAALRAWGLPEPLCEAVGGHDRVPLDARAGDAPRPAVLVGLARALVLLGELGDCPVGVDPVAVAGALGLERGGRSHAA